MNVPVVPGHPQGYCSGGGRHTPLRMVTTNKSDNKVMICALCDYTADGAGPPAQAFIRPATP